MTKVDYVRYIAVIQKMSVILGANEINTEAKVSDIVVICHYIPAVFVDL